MGARHESPLRERRKRVGILTVIVSEVPGKSVVVDVIRCHAPYSGHFVLHAALREPSQMRATVLSDRDLAVEVYLHQGERLLVHLFTTTGNER